MKLIRMIRSPGRCTAFDDRARLLLVMAVLAPIVGWYVDAGNVASAMCTDPQNRGEVLVYTDNSPGSIALADGMHQTIRVAGYATTVTTDESEFVRALPTQRWSSVLVVARYSSTPPVYLDALRTYVGNGGWAQIYSWRDDPNTPAASGSVVLSPTAIQIWTNGSTCKHYVLCEGTRNAEATTGYSLCDFAGVSADSALALDVVDCAALAAGQFQPITATPQTLAEAWLNYIADLAEALARFQEDVALCNSTYGGDQNATPPIPGDGAALATCLQAAGTEYAQRCAAAYRRYTVLKKKLSTPSSQPVP